MREFVRSARRRRGCDLQRYLPTLAGDAQRRHALRGFAVDLAPLPLWPDLAEAGTRRILQANVTIGRPDRARRP